MFFGTVMYERMVIPVLKLLCRIFRLARIRQERE